MAHCTQHNYKRHQIGLAKKYTLQLLCVLSYKIYFLSLSSSYSYIHVYLEKYNRILRLQMYKKIYTNKDIH